MLRCAPEQPALLWVGSNFETGPAQGGRLDQGTSRAFFQLKIIVGFSDPKFSNTHRQQTSYFWSNGYTRKHVFTFSPCEKCHIFTGEFTQPFPQKEASQVTHPFFFFFFLKTYFPKHLCKLSSGKDGEIN